MYKQNDSIRATFQYIFPCLYSSVSFLSSPLLSYPLLYSLLSSFVLFSFPSLPLPPRDVELGDVVVVGQCRPLSKTVRFNVLKVQKAKGGKKQFQKF